MKCRAAPQSSLLGRAVARPVYPKKHRSSGEPGDDRLAIHRRGISCKLGTRNISRRLCPDGQVSGQETFNVILDPADNIRVDMYGCQESYRQQMYKYLPTDFETGFAYDILTFRVGASQRVSDFDLSNLRTSFTSSFASDS